MYSLYFLIYYFLLSINLNTIFDTAFQSVLFTTKYVAILKTHIYMAFLKSYNTSDVLPFQPVFKMGHFFLYYCRVGSKKYTL